MRILTGIDIGGTKCAVIKGTADGKVLEKIKIPTTTYQETINNIFNALDELGVGESIGISCGGPLDEKRGLILSPPNLPTWDKVPICQMLSEKYKVPVAIRNDANACALAEWKFGAGVGKENLVFLTFGTGLGAGLILNGKLYSGSTGNAGEVGHIGLSPFGPSGYGKNGSFEGFCSGSGLYELGRGIARTYVQNGLSPAFIKDKNYNDFTVKDMADSARNGDKCALEVFDLCATMLGKGLAIIADIIDPEMIIIGSVYARCEDLLKEKTILEMRKNALGVICDNLEIVPAKLSESIGDVASLAVASSILN